MPQQWILPGSTATYLVVWWYDAAAKDPKRRVPVLTVLASLDGWMRSRRHVVRQIYDALEGSMSLDLSGLRASPRDEQLKERLVKAFRNGRLIVLIKEEGVSSATPPGAASGSALPKQGRSGTQGSGEDRVPFRVHLVVEPSDPKRHNVTPKFKRMSSQEFIELACLQAFGLKNKEDVKNLRLKIEGFEGRPNPVELSQGYVDMEFSARVYAEGILSKFGTGSKKAQAELDARREKYDTLSKVERDAIAGRVDDEFEKRTGHKPSKSKSQASTRVWESVRDDVLREDEVAAGTKYLSKDRNQEEGNKEAFQLGVVVQDKAPPLQFRSSPTTTGDNFIGNLAFNTPVQIMERLPGGWLHVGTLTQGSGYVAASYVWSAPEHPVPEAGARLHRVARYKSATGKGTAIAIAEAHYDIKSGQGLPFYVALLALVNGVSIPRTMDGWKELRFQADQFIWVPSQEFADSMRGKLPSGSSTYELLDLLGLAELVDKIQDALDRAAQILDDLAMAIWLSGPYILEAIAKHVEEALISVLQSLLLMAAFSVLFLGACTAIGAWLGAGGPGAAAGFKIGMALLDWMGLGFLIQWAGVSIARVGSALLTFLVSVWNARGNQSMLDQAARELAEVFGIIAGMIVELLLMWATAKGVSKALESLKGSQLERAFGEGRLNSWLREAVQTYNKAKPEIKIKGREVLKVEIKERIIQVKTPAQMLNWLQASQLARDLGLPEVQRKGLLKSSNPRDAVISASKRKLSLDLQISEASAETLLQSKNPRKAIFQTRTRNLARNLSITEAEAELLLRVTEKALQNELGKGNDFANALRRALGHKAEWQRFNPEMEAAFKKRLLKFRRKLDLSMDTKYSGQEGQIFESEAEPGVCLKRWFKRALNKMPESIRLLEEAYMEIHSDPKLRDLIEVVRIHEHGEDWILRDFEFDSIPLSKALDAPKVSSVRAALVKELQAKQTEGTLSEVLSGLLKKLGEPPSANIHWSPTKKKCVIIDML